MLTTVAVTLAAVMLVSGVEATTAPEVAASAPRAVDSRGVPLLASSPPAPQARAGADPGADFAPHAALDGSSGTRFDPQRSRLLSRSMFTEEYENPDGTPGPTARTTGTTLPGG